jgi:hypothetical protein
MHKIYTPSKEILEAIDFDSDSIHIVSSFPANAGDHAIDAYACSFIGMIMANYNRRRVDLREKADFTHNVYAVATEGLKNAKEHGCRTQGMFSHIVLIGTNGVCQGFFDGGNFFKKPHVKRLLEERLPIPEEEMDRKRDSAHLGIVGYIYPNAEMIEVDSENNVLYCAHLINSR